MLPDRQAQYGLLCLEHKSKAPRVVADVLLFDQLELSPLLGVESIYGKGKRRMKKEALPFFQSGTGARRVVITCFFRAADHSSGLRDLQERVT